MSSRLAPWLLCIAYAYPVSVHAQAVTTGSIGGYVYDQQRGALAGVTITATSPDVPGTRQTVSTPTGAYRLIDLHPGTYTLTAEHPGFARYTLPDIRVGAGLNLGLEIVLPLGDVSETVEVTHSPPMLEVLRPGQSLNISGDFQRDVPLTRRRDWAQFMELLPGVSARESQTNQTYFYHGSPSVSHVLQLDGADVMSAQAGANIWINLSTDAIADIQVKAAVADASVPLGTGAAANVVTRSGNDAFHGSANFVYQNRRWSDSNNPSGSASDVSLIQPDLALGGPLTRGRVWFFGSYQHLHARYGISRSGSELAALSALVPDFQPFANENNASFAFGKLSYRSGNHDLTGYSQYDRNPADSNFATDASRLRGTTLGGPAHSVSLSSVLSPSLLSRIVLSYNAKGQDSVGDLTRPSRVVYERVAPSGGRLVGTNILATLDSQGVTTSFPYTKVVLSADLTHSRNTSFGSHDLQLGIYWQRQKERSDSITSNGGAYRVEEVLRDAANPAEGSVPFRLTVNSPDRFPVRDNRAHDFAGYFQDLWRPHPRLTIAAGLRLDAVFRRDRLFERTVQDSLDIGPRFGGTLALDTQSRHIVHAAIGRIHEGLPFQVVTTGSSTATVQDSYDLDGDRLFETTFITPGVTQASSNRRFDASFHQAYVNERSVGYRHQFWGQTIVDVTWLHRAFRDLPTLVEINGLYMGDVFVGYADESVNEIGLLTNNSYNWSVYDAAAVYVSKRTARLQMFGSYTRQWRHTAGTWQPRDPASFIQPAAFPNARGIDLTNGSTSTIRNSYAAPTGLQWRDQALRAAGTIRLPLNVYIAGDYTLQTGAWSGPLLTTLAPDPRFGPPTVRLSNGRVVSNPLATPTRFVNSSRGEGQFTADSLHVVNLRLARELTLPRSRLELSVSVFNLLNGAADQSIASVNVTSTSFGLGTNRQLPRAAQVGVRLTF